jgi:NAD(P)-dependent dehydrogenase (short-subunit alcohol dehydrogenase family)
MDLELRGKAAIVTGGSRGIGKAIARELIREGASVAIAARTRATVEATADELRTETPGAQVVPIVADTGSDDSVKAMVEQAVTAMGTVNILVNSAAEVGSRVAFKLPDITEAPFHHELDIKVLGALRCIQHVAPHMIEAGWGRIITISGLAARSTNSIIGSTRNAALVAMCKNVADELGPHGITVTVVHPGLTLTEYYRAQMESVAESRGITVDEAIQERFANNLLGRPIAPSEVAYVVAFLASPKSVAVNGDVIAEGGGTPRAIHY